VLREEKIGGGVWDSRERYTKEKKKERDILKSKTKKERGYKHAKRKKGKGKCVSIYGTRTGSEPSKGAAPA